MSDSTTTDMGIDMNTQTRAQRAFSKLQNMGAPVLRFGKEDVALFVLSAEDNEKEIWADYWGEFGSGYPEVSPKVTKILDQYGLVYEWNDAGSVYIYEGA